MNIETKFSAYMTIVIGGLGLLFILIAIITPSEAPVLVDSETGAAFTLPTMYELQEGLLAAGYDIGTDGVDGVPGPNTIAAWERYSIKKEASEWDYYYEPNEVE